jgi:hypothetical protein
LAQGGKKDVDGRVKPGHDEGGVVNSFAHVEPWMAGTGPAMTRINPDHIFRTHCHLKRGEIKPEWLRRSAKLTAGPCC